MSKDSGPTYTSAVKKTYVAPTLTVFGGLRDLTLQQAVLEMPSDNKGSGVGGKIVSG